MSALVQQQQQQQQEQQQQEQDEEGAQHTHTHTNSSCPILRLFLGFLCTNPQGNGPSQCSLAGWALQ